MKGVYAQPLALLNVQTVKVENLPNVYSSFYDLDETSDQIPGYNDAVTTAATATFTQATLGNMQAALNAATDPETVTVLTEQVRIATLENLEAQAAANQAAIVVNPNSILDLSRATELENVIVTEGFGTGTDAVLGSLTVVGIRGDATARLEGSFSQNVSLNYSEGLTDGINLILDLGLIAGPAAAGNGGFFNVEPPAPILSIAHNSATLNIDSVGGGNVLPSASLGQATLLDLNVSGEAVLFISSSLNDAFMKGHPANITTTNTAGVDLTLNEFDDEIIFTGKTFKYPKGDLAEPK